MKVENECRINFKYRLSPKSYIVSKTVFSNLVETQIIENTLEVNKRVNKSVAISFDILIYTIYICNISNFTVKNIFLQDNIPKGTRFIENSVLVNGVKKRCVNPLQGFYVDNLNSGNKVMVTFKVLILPMPLKSTIKNYSTIEYDYIYNVEKFPIRISKNSNNVQTNLENKLFKQISLGKTLKLRRSIRKIINTKCSIKIIKTKVINKLSSNACTLLVIGKIEFQMWYKRHHHIRFLEEVFGFSTCLLVPVGIKYAYDYKIRTKLEYLSTKLINKKTLFININLLLYY